MNEEQMGKFVKWYENYKYLDYDRLKDAWEACLLANNIGDLPAPIPDGYYKIGEVIHIRRKGTSEWLTGRSKIVFHGQITDDLDRFEVRRIPAWCPKDNEPVMFSVDGDKRLIGVYVDGVIISNNYNFKASGVEFEKFDASKAGKKWGDK